jgi:hypothetical protein
MSKARSGRRHGPPARQRRRARRHEREAQRARGRARHEGDGPVPMVDPATDKAAQELMDAAVALMNGSAEQLGCAGNGGISATAEERERALQACRVATAPPATPSLAE